jgi:hypothetical protein
MTFTPQDEAAPRPRRKAAATAGEGAKADVEVPAAKRRRVVVRKKSAPEEGPAI